MSRLGIVGLPVARNQWDRCAGALVGLAIGDALGTGYNLEAEGPGDAGDGGGADSWEPGEWTDDTQLASCIAEVAATGVLDIQAVGERFLSWFQGNPGPKRAGRQTRAVLSRAPSGRDLPGVAADYFDAHPRESAGNGSLMRTAPVALAHLGDDVAMAEAARGVSALTHGDPLAGEACVLWCIALDRAIREERLDGAYDGLARLPVDRRPYWEARLYEAERMPPTAFDPGGFVVATFQAAYAAVIQTAIADRNPPDHLRAALTTALRAGHGTDTVATIAGALLGARWGYQEIPAVWLLLLHGWPGSNFVDLVHLAVRSVNRSAAGRRRASI